MKTPDHPALFVTTHTTLPTLAGIAAAFSFAAVAFAFTLTGTFSPVPWLGMNTKDVGIVLLTFSSFLFIFSVQACVISHAWDHNALTQEQRTAWKIPENHDYKKRCATRLMLWHRFAAWGYNSATFTLLLGLVFLLWNVSPWGSVLAISFLGVWLVIGVLSNRMPDTMEAIMTKIESYLVKP